jgi:predicted RecB family nuclease
MPEINQEEIFLLAEKKLSKFVNKYEKAQIYDLSALQKFQNLIECIPEIQDSNEFYQLMDETEDFIFYAAQGKKPSKNMEKVTKMVDLFMLIKNECLTPEEKQSSMKEKVFLTVCAVAWTMLIFAP